MSGGLIALLAVTIGFAALVYWVYSPSRRRQLEDHGRIPLEGDGDTPANPRKADGERDE